jgi:hypothetical protein
VRPGLALRWTARHDTGPVSLRKGSPAMPATTASTEPGGFSAAERVHVTVTAAAPGLSPRTWYGMPARLERHSAVTTTTSQPPRSAYPTAAVTRISDSNGTVSAMSQASPSASARSRS